MFVSFFISLTRSEILVTPVIAFASQGLRPLLMVATDGRADDGADTGETLTRNSGVGGLECVMSAFATDAVLFFFLEEHFRMVA